MYEYEPSNAVLTEAEACQFLKLSRRTLQKWRLQGGGPKYIRVSYRAVRYRLEDLNAWLEERCFANSSAAKEAMR